MIYESMSDMHISQPSILDFDSDIISLIIGCKTDMRGHGSARFSGIVKNFDWQTQAFGVQIGDNEYRFPISDLSAMSVYGVHGPSKNHLNIGVV